MELIRTKHHFRNLKRSIQNQSIETVRKHVLNSHQLELNAALLIATELESIEIVKLLIDSGADINWHDGDRISPLSRALSLANIKTAQLLVDRGADAQYGIDQHLLTAVLNTKMSRDFRQGRFIEKWSNTTSWLYSLHPNKDKAVEIIESQDPEIGNQFRKRLNAEQSFEKLSNELKQKAKSDMPSKKMKI